ncbi:MAG TPA: glycosyltransferase 87 family protein [Candidatus Cybelea sp.]
MTARKIVAIAVLALLGVAALRDLGRLGDSLPWNRLYDFADFYCAGSAVDRHANPYRYEPLHRCEHAVNRTPAYRADPHRVVPAPLPPYDFPAFAALSHLSFERARTLAAIAIVLAVVASIAGLAALGIPVDVAALALFFPAGYLLLDAGQIVPFALAALVFCGVALARGRDTLAGLLAALMLIEPHLGLPVFVALLLLAPRARAGASIAGLLMLAIGVFSVGLTGIREYVLGVLPAQAAAETSYVYQYSLTYLLARAGLPAAPALIAGQICYVAMLAAGIWLGARAAKSLHRRELIAYLPAACGIVGGTYVHMIDVSIAIPAALVLAVFARGRARLVASLAVALLAVPWIPVWIGKKLLLATLFVVAGLLLRLKTAPLSAALTFAAVALVVYGFELNPPPPFPSAAAAATFSPNDFAQTAWAAYVRAIGSPAPGWFLVKIPTWAALLAIVGVAWDAALARPSQT